jgi:methionyl-tRNA formyltransferase
VTRTVLSDVLLIAGHTPRSQAYVQTLAAHDLLPAHVLLLGDAPPSAAGEPTHTEHIGDVLLPDLSVPLATSLTAAAVPYTWLATRDVNADEVREAVCALQPRLIIYSGYGGALVQRPLLELGITLLHVHSGWLPDYRGSTTLYYSLLCERRCAASALVLDAHIDTGPVVARKHYPAPPAGTDIDKRYDPAIRADLLREVLQSYHSTGHLPFHPPQRRDDGSTFYVIHPVLKHLALLGLPER